MSLDKASQNVYTKLESIFIDGGPIRIGVKGTLLIAVVIGTMIGLTESPKVSLSLHLALPVESSHFLQTGVKIGGSEMIEVESPLSVKSRDFWEHTQPSCTIGMSCAQKLGLPKIKGTPRATIRGSQGHAIWPLTPITAPWPFYKWGIEITGPFPEGPRKVKFLIVAIDYFTKWIKAKAVETISGGQVKKFV
ncbi:reverse transcriptase domain-containing protein [Tanacetum coccineum]|uniref:Reverse transcriptase domain-containing protein n=1 Tax=Tanacetum coccineum TaxID=301880 RepID=A0ABQ4YE84_9ASTR